MPEGRTNGETAKPGKWKRTIGSLTFFNGVPARARLPLVEPVPLAAETIRSAFVSGFASRETAMDAQLYSGAVYREDGRIVPEFLEYERLPAQWARRRVNAPFVEASRVASSPRLEEPCVYLGDLHGHFGHFLLESLARAWYLIECDPKVRLLFHGRSERPPLGPFADTIFQALNVNPSRIKIVLTDTNVTNLVLPAAQYWQSLKASPGMCVVFDHLREKILSARRHRHPSPRKIYFTRRHLAAVLNSGKPRKAISNEHEVEALFRKRGFEIVSPETLPFEEQIAMVANATHVAGTSGSALHLILFNNNPCAKVIELRTKPAINQLLISAIRGIEAFHIWSRAFSGPVAEVVLELDIIDRAMKEIE